ncbi:hypothetical protein CHU98_g6636, partial [Xylaria longipes]
MEASEKFDVIVVGAGKTRHKSRKHHKKLPSSSPIIPEWPEENFEKSIVIHSLEIGIINPNYIEKHVRHATVVGRSKSSYECRLHVAQVRQESRLRWLGHAGWGGFGTFSASTRRNSWASLWNIADHISTRFASNFSPCIMNTEGGLYTTSSNALRRAEPLPMSTGECIYTAKVTREPSRRSSVRTYPKCSTAYSVTVRRFWPISLVPRSRRPSVSTYMIDVSYQKSFRFDQSISALGRDGRAANISCISI